MIKRDSVRELAFLGVCGVEHRRHNDGSAREVRHLVIGDGVVHGFRADPAKADVGSSNSRNGPGEAPTVAMEHRQRPEINGMHGHTARERVRVAHEGRAAMVIDDAFGIAGRARRIVERDRVPLVGRPAPFEVRVALTDKGFVVDIR